MQVIVRPCNKCERLLCHDRNFRATFYCKHKAPICLTNKDNSLTPSKRPRTTGAKRELQGEEMLKTEKNIEEAVLAKSRQMGHTNETLGNLVQECRRTNNMLRVFVETIGSNEQTYQVPCYEQL